MTADYQHNQLVQAVIANKAFCRTDNPLRRGRHSEVVKLKRSLAERPVLPAWKGCKQSQDWAILGRASIAIQYRDLDNTVCTTKMSSRGHWAYVDM